MKDMLKPIISFLILLFLVALNQWLSLHLEFKQDYLRFYLNNGPLIGLVTAIVVITWEDLSKNIGLISPNPHTYLLACFRVVKLPVFVLSKEFNDASEKWDTITKAYKFGVIKFRLEDLWLCWDILFSWLLGLIIIGSLIVWLVLVVPLQYFVFLFAGAAPRSFALLLSEKQIATLQEGELRIEPIRKNESIPEGWWDASFSQKPVAVTAVISSLLLWIVNLAV